MTNDSVLTDLVSYNGDAPMLSVYLDTDLAAKSKDAVKLDCKSNIKGMEAAPQEDDIEAVMNYLDYEYSWNPRGLALFVVEGAVKQAVPLPAAVPGKAYYAAHPYIRPLVDLRDRFGDYVVAVVDRENVRLFSISSGSIRSETESYGEQIKRHKQGGWAAARYQRREDNLALQNMKQAAELINEFCADSGYHRLILAGSEGTLHQIQEMLPSPLRRTIIAQFVADMRITPLEVLHTTQQLLAASDQENEARLVTETITAASKGGAGVRGLADTLYTLREGRARQLLISSNLESSGYECSHCQYLAEEPFGSCPFCGGKDAVHNQDVVNSAIVKAVKGAVAVNVIRNNQELDDAGGIAAVLRY